MPWPTSLAGRSSELNRPEAFPKATERAASGAALFVSAVVLLLLIAPSPGGPWTSAAPRFFNELENLGHPVAFALLGTLLLRQGHALQRLSPAKRYLIVMTALTTLGGLVELVQAFTGRDPSWRDVLANAAGAGIAVAWDARRMPNLRTWSTTLLLLLLAMVLTPLLWTTAAYVHRSHFAPRIWSEGSRLTMQFANFTYGEYPGITIHEPLRDWRKYEALVVMVENPGDRPAHVTVSVRDLGHGRVYADRFNEEFTIPAKKRVMLRQPIGKIERAPEGRSLDLQRIDSVSVFQIAEALEPTVRVHEVRLSP